MIALVTLDSAPFQHEKQPQQALKLPDLDNFTYGVLNDVASFEDSQPSDTEIGQEDEKAEEEDVWTSIPFTHFDAQDRKSSTWERFYDKSHEEKKIYLSEASPEIWNAVWAQVNDEDLSNGAFPNELALKGLFNLGLGLSSALFFFSEVRAHPRSSHVSASGLSTELTSDLVQIFGEIGLRFRRIAQYVNEISQDPSVCPSVVAATSIVGRIATCIRREIVSRASRPATILRLRHTFQRPELILKKLATFIEDIKSFKDDVEAINFVYYFAESFESVDPWFRPIALKILSLVVNPWLKTLGQQIGLFGSVSGGIGIERIPEGLSQIRKANPDNHASLSQVFPNFLDSEQTEMLVNTTQSLELLNTRNKQGSEFYNAANLSIEVPALEVALTWEDIERIQQKATEYETNVKRLQQDMEAAGSYNKKGSELESMLPTTNSFWDEGEDQVEESFFAAYDSFASAPAEEILDHDLSNIVQLAHHPARHHGSQSNSPPLISLSSSISLDAILLPQARLVNLAILKVLFQECDAVHHFEVQRVFQLLGSGVFLSRLRQALYSQELSSAERWKGHARSGTMGLRLGSRKTWPPASAELRLVLRDILSDCYQELFSSKSRGKTSEDLPVDLSFSIRRLSEPEIQACLNSDSLQALDFLRLQYSPPPIVSQIITEALLEKYDRIFRFLMRVMRVSVAITESSNFDLVYGVGAWSGKIKATSTRIRIEAQHFVNSLLLYIHTSISSLWNRFFKIVESLNRSILTDHVDHLGHIDGVFQLRKLHEAMLDQMLFKLLLRNRQKRVMEVLEDILSGILGFTQLRKILDDDDDRFALRLFGIHRELSEKQKLFIAVCKELSEKATYKVADSLVSTLFAREWHAGEASSAGIESLITMLDMNGYYGRP